jgi:arabinogalactan oligomer/maltooligosaccharide transport system permease protein
MKKKNKFIPWGYSFPSILLIGMIVVFPIIYTIYISFTNMNLYHWTNYEFIAFDNYRRALTKLDTGFMSALLTTILWTVLNMVIQILLAYLIALGLNAEGLKLARLYKTLLMFPWAMPAYISILLWKVGMYNPQYGILNKILSTLGFSNVDFLSENIPAFLSCMVLNLWMALPFLIMMMDGALQSVDISYYESARLDGGGWWAQNLYITIPSIKPILAPCIIMTTFTTFKQFDIIYLLTMQKGFLTGATLQTVITYVHQKAFVSNNYGLSSAVSIIIFGFIILFSLFINRGIREEKV